jgi:hypothetical protein
MFGKYWKNNFSQHRPICGYFKEKWDKKGSSLFVMLMICYPLLMAKLNLKITACPSLTSICSATQTY